MIRFLHMLSKVSNFSNMLLCRIGTPKAVKFCCGSLNTGVELWTPAVFSMADDIATVLQSLCSSPDVSRSSKSTVSVEDQFHHSSGSEEKSIGKSIANGSETSLCSLLRLGLEALMYQIYIRMINISIGCLISPWTPSSRVPGKELHGILS